MTPAQAFRGIVVTFAIAAVLLFVCCLSGCDVDTFAKTTQGIGAIFAIAWLAVAGVFLLKRWRR